jgi:hypothetical protein
MQWVLLPAHVCRTTTTVVTTTVSTTSTAIQTAIATAEDVITVTTPSSTSTTSVEYTATYTTVTYTPGFLLKRTVTESPAIPTYASACSGAVRYSSACSCFGVFPTTSTSTILVTPVRIGVLDFLDTTDLYRL